jgi:hypothetical protein
MMVLILVAHFRGGACLCFEGCGMTICSMMLASVVVWMDAFSLWPHPRWFFGAIGCLPAVRTYISSVVSWPMFHVIRGWLNTSPSAIVTMITWLNAS